MSVYAASLPEAAAGRAEEILRDHGDTAFSRIARLPSYRRTLVGGTSVVAWVRKGPFALVLGEPVGPEPHRERVIAGFTEHCRHAGIYPVWLPVASDRLDPFEAAGYRHLGIGRTARVDLPGFDVSGRRARSLRNGINRARRAGVRFEIWSPGEDGWEPLREVSRSWLGTKRLDERRFGMGWFHPDYLETQTVAVARNRFGRVEGFATWMNVRGGTEGAVDLMRHRPEAPPGTMDTLIAGIAQHLQEEGKEVLDLGLAPLAGLSGGLLHRFLGQVYRHGRPFYDFHGLFLFKNKFKPRWSPMVLAYPRFWQAPPLFAGLARLLSHSVPDPRMGGAQFSGFARIPGHRKG